jgi:hypothetical protein
VKDKRIVVLVDEAEKERVEWMAKNNGFDNVSDFIRWLWRDWADQVKKDVVGE